MKADQPGNSVVRLRRWISALLFLSVFFLPLHIHLATAATSQLSKECSCVQGTRTQLASAVDVPHATAPVELNVVASECESLAAHLWFNSHKVRGPPTLTSL